MFFDWLKQINCYLSEEWTKDCATLFKSGTQISGKESKWNLCLKSVQSLAPSLPPGSHFFLVQITLEMERVGLHPTRYCCNTGYIGIYWNTFEMQLENFWNWRSMLEQRCMPSDLAATPAASFWENTFWFFSSQAAEFTPHRKTMTMSCREFKICISEQCEQVC